MAEQTDLTVLDEDNTLALMGIFHENPEDRLMKVQMIRQWMVVHPENNLMGNENLQKVLNVMASDDLKLLRLKQDAGLNDGLKAMLPVVQELFSRMKSDPFRTEKPVAEIKAPQISMEDLPEEEIPEYAMRQGDDSSSYEELFSFEKEE